MAEQLGNIHAQHKYKPFIGREPVLLPSQIVQEKSAMEKMEKFENFVSACVKISLFIVLGFCAIFVLIARIEDR